MWQERGPCSLPVYFQTISYLFFWIQDVVQTPQSPSYVGFLPSPLTYILFFSKSSQPCPNRSHHQPYHRLSWHIGIEQQREADPWTRPSPRFKGDILLQWLQKQNYQNLIQQKQTIGCLKRKKMLPRDLIQQGQRREDHRRAEAFRCSGRDVDAQHHRDHEGR